MKDLKIDLNKLSIEGLKAYLTLLNELKQGYDADLSVEPETKDLPVPPYFNPKEDNKQEEIDIDDEEPSFNV